MSGINKVTYRLGGKSARPPIGSSGSISLKSDPQDPDAPPRVTQSVWEFEFRNTEQINDHNAGGLSSGVGIREGLRYEVDITDDEGTLNVLDSYLDGTDRNVIYSKNRISNLPSKLRGKNDWFSEVAGRIYFANLLASGGITQSQVIQVPYVLNTIPNYKEAAITAITGYIVIKDLRNMGKELGNIGAELASVLSAIAAILKMIVVILWIIIQIATLIQFIAEVFNHLIQPVKFHATMRWVDQLRAGCKALGLEFQSSIFEQDRYKDAVIMESKFKSFEDVKNEDSLGFTTPSTDSNGYYKDSFAQLVLDAQDTFMAKVEITDDNKFIFERIDKGSKEEAYVLPPIPLDKYSTNQSDLISTYSMSFRTDLSDENTIDNYEGTASDIITQPIIVNDKFAEIGGRLEIVDIPFARASRKEGLNTIEKKFDRLYKNNSKAVNAIVKIANGIIKVRNSVVSTLSKIIKKLKVIGINIPIELKPIPLLNSITPNSISNRVGMMMLSADHFEVRKIMSLDIDANPMNTKLKEDNIIIWDTRTLYNDFHRVLSFVPSKDFPNGNQFRIYKAADIPFCKEDGLKVLNNSRIFATVNSEQVKAKITDGNWIFKNKFATGLVIWISHLETTNLETKIITPNGL